MTDDDLLHELRSLRAELRSLRAQHAREIADLWRAQAKLQETLADLHRQAIDREAGAPVRRVIN
jgi:hypothetical protein